MIYFIARGNYKKTLDLIKIFHFKYATVTGVAKEI